MPSEKDDLVLRPRWRTRVELFNLPFEFHPTIVALVLEPESGWYL